MQSMMWNISLDFPHLGLKVFQRQVVTTRHGLEFQDNVPNAFQSPRLIHMGLCEIQKQPRRWNVNVSLAKKNVRCMLLASWLAFKSQMTEGGRKTWREGDRKILYWYIRWALQGIIGSQSQLIGYDVCCVKNRNWAESILLKHNPCLMGMLVFNTH